MSDASNEINDLLNGPSRTAWYFVPDSRSANATVSATVHHWDGRIETLRVPVMPCETDGSESKTTYKCEECGCEIVDRGDGTAEVSSPRLFFDCATCSRATAGIIAEAGKRAAQRVNDEYMRILGAGDFIVPGCVAVESPKTGNHHDLG